MPNAKKERVTKLADLRFEIRVKEPAERNLANHRVRELLADHFGVTKGDVQLVTGHHSRVKMFDVTV